MLEIQSNQDALRMKDGDNLKEPQQRNNMAISKWEPLRSMEDLLDRYSRSLGFPIGRSGELLANGEWHPRVDISENGDTFVIKAEIPGVKKDDVKVTVDNGLVTLEGEREQEREEKGWRYHRIEREYGNFIRSFTLPSNADSSKLKAQFHDGLLEVVIPKAEGTKTKAVSVPIEGD
jgi:HSP20 family protein